MVDESVRRGPTRRAFLGTVAVGGAALAAGAAGRQGALGGAEVGADGVGQAPPAVERHDACGASPVDPAGASRIALRPRTRPL